MFVLYESRRCDGPKLPSKSEFDSNSLENLLENSVSIRKPVKHKLTDFVFPSEMTRFPTNTRPTTTRPTTTSSSCNTPKTTKQTPTWVENPTTKKSDLLPWMQDVLNEYSTTPKGHPNQNNQNQSTRPAATITTTQMPIRSTTINSFWSEWSITEPPTLNQGGKPDLSTERSRQTTTEPFKDRMTTEKETLLPWMQDVLDEIFTSTKSDVDKLIRSTSPRPTPPQETGMPSWMQDVLNEYSNKPIQISTPSTPLTQSGTGDRPKLIFGDGSLTIGDGNGGGVNGDLHLPSQNRYCGSPIKFVFILF